MYEWVLLYVNAGFWSGTIKFEYGDVVKMDDRYEHLSDFSFINESDWVMRDKVYAPRVWTLGGEEAKDIRRDHLEELIWIYHFKQIKIKSDLQSLNRTV